MAVSCFCFYVIEKLDANSTSTSASIIISVVSVEEILESFSAVLALIVCRLAILVKLYAFGNIDLSTEFEVGNFFEKVSYLVATNSILQNSRRLDSDSDLYLRGEHSAAIDGRLAVY